MSAPAANAMKPETVILTVTLALDLHDQGGAMMGLDEIDDYISQVKRATAEVQAMMPSRQPFQETSRLWRGMLWELNRCKLSLESKWNEIFQPEYMWWGIPEEHELQQTPVTDPYKESLDGSNDNNATSNVQPPSSPVETIGRVIEEYLSDSPSGSHESR